MISDVESGRVDPQQRLVLECVHMALEDGGFTRKQIYGSNTGVVIGKTKVPFFMNNMHNIKIKKKDFLYVAAHYDRLHALKYYIKI